MFKKIAALILLVLLVTGAGVNVYANAFIPYKTFTYPALFRYTSEMPYLYVPGKIYNGTILGTEPLLEPSDLYVDMEGGLYVADTGNNRIVCLNDDWTVRLTISSFNNNGTEDSLKGPRGVFVTQKGGIYVADTENNRLVEFSYDGSFVRVIASPVSPLLQEGFVFSPIAVAVDKAERIYVVAMAVNQGIMQLSKAGEFEGFLGAQRVSYNLVDYVWKQYLSSEQRARMRSFVPTEYNNIAIDEEGFLYVTASNIAMGELISDIMSPSKSPSVAPVRRLNPSGEDVLRRTGNTAIVGDLSFWDTPSIIRDVALGEAGTYTLMDTTKQRYFTYTYDGDLIGVFGGYGKQNGNTMDVSAITYRGSDLIALDKRTGQITVFERTEYGDKIIDALAKFNDFDYNESVAVWEEVLQQNGSYDLAFINIGKSYLRNENYKGAMDYFQKSLDDENYSIAFKEKRNLWIEKNLVFVAPLFILFLYLLSRLFSAINKVNKGERFKPHRQRTVNQVLYGFYIMMHPFDGFWDMKHEKRGGLAAANIIVGLALLSIVVKDVFTSFMYSPYMYYNAVSLPSIFLQIALPLVLWVTSNWCFTSLMDGKGTYRDVYITTSYALLPYALFGMLSTLFTHFFSLEERVFVDILQSIGLYWTGGLILFGNLVTHQYTLFKSIVSAGLTIVGIGIIIFLAVVFGGTITEIIQFIYIVMQEIMLRA